MTSTAAIVRKMERAANNVDGLTKAKGAWLLNLASRTIQEQRDEITTNVEHLNPAPEFRAMAQTIDIFSAEEVAAKLREAADIIEALQMIAERKVH
jgi:hypothetical protein